MRTPHPHPPTHPPTRDDAPLREQEVGQLAHGVGLGGPHRGADGLQVSVAQAHHCGREQLSAGQSVSLEHHGSQLGSAGGTIGGGRHAAEPIHHPPPPPTQTHIRPRSPDSMPWGLPIWAAADMLSARTLTTCNAMKGGGMCVCVGGGGGGGGGHVQGRLACLHCLASLLQRRCSNVQLSTPTTTPLNHPPPTPP